MLHLQPARSSRPAPAEDLGRARLFRDAVRRVDHLVDAAMNAIAAPIHERLRRHRHLRPEQPLGVIGTWVTTMPEDYRVGPSRVVRHKTELAIVETRLTVSWLNDRGWGTDEHERGLAVAVLTFGVRDGKLIRTWRPRINLSLHAMGRWFEHTGKREHELLLADLTRLAEAPETAGDKVYCPPRGIWLGAVTEAPNDHDQQGVKLRNVRTWLAS